MIKQSLFSLLLTTSALSFIPSVSTAAPAELQGLLSEIRSFSTKDRAINQKREAEFRSDVAQQQNLLSKSQIRLQNAEFLQDNLKARFDENESQLADLETQLAQRTAKLGEVFGVARQVATELQPILDDSMINAELGNRSETLAFAETKRVPTLKELEELWFQLQQEMLLSGQIKTYEGEIVNSSGEAEIQPITRIGLFTAATNDGRFLNWDSSQQTLVELPTQPTPSEQSEFARYASGQSDVALIDPSRGQLLSLLSRMPKLIDRVHQGGEVGYIIIGLGLIGLLVALWQLVRMLLTEFRVQGQLKRMHEPKAGNPLGRVVLAAASETSTTESELKTDEAILKELPNLERGQTFLKLVAAVAPLLGLLGTVVGMIATFQSITLFGTSDPKLMAGGISQALITTVLGLVVAIPLLFSHSLLSSRSKRISQLLQEKSLAAILDQKNHNNLEVVKNAA